MDANKLPKTLLNYKPEGRRGSLLSFNEEQARQVVSRFSRPWPLYCCYTLSFSVTTAMVRCAQKACRGFKSVERMWIGVGYCLAFSSLEDSADRCKVGMENWIRVKTEQARRRRRGRKADLDCTVSLQALSWQYWMYWKPLCRLEEFNIQFYEIWRIISAFIGRWKSCNDPCVHKSSNCGTQNDSTGVEPPQLAICLSAHCVLNSWTGCYSVQQAM
jgi:hypothetical protein